MLPEAAVGMLQKTFHSTQKQSMYAMKQHFVGSRYRWQEQGNSPTID